MTEDKQARWKGAGMGVLTEALLLNGYAIKSRIKFKEFPREESID